MTAQNDLINQSSPKSQTDPAVRKTSHGKEIEIPPVQGEILQEVSGRIEIQKEVRESGVEEIHGVIELPPDIKKLGVTPTGFQTPASAAPVVPSISLPISDDKIFQGANAPITSAFKWLSIWCLKRLKSVHLMLKSIHGKIIRVKIY